MTDEEAEPDVCPACRAQLAYGGGFTRAAMVEVPGVYDGGLYWMCPACGHAWHRWPVGHRLRERAAPYVMTANRAARP